MLEMAKMSSFILVAHVDNGQMDLKIYFSRYCFDVLRNIFNFICLLFQGLNMVKLQLLVIPNMNAKSLPI